MALSSGDKLGSYEIVSRLGSGGMGVVYRACDAKLGRDVAIKLLSAKGATDPDRLRRFEQEARAASALDHPNIITIHEIGETDDGQPYLVMQLVEGKSLREIIASSRLSLSESLSIATQIADGLARAHQHGIVHRDLKPDNVMVNADGLVKILDFGLAKLAEPAVDSELATIDRARPHTQEGTIVGTAHYMSPEQAGGESVDARSDIFSLGAVLYEMVTGRRAFGGDNTVAVLADVVNQDPDRVSKIDPSLPIELDRIVHRALRKDPARRFQNASDLKVALAELGEELASGDVLTVSDVRARGASSLTRRWWVVTAGLAVACGVTAGAISMWPPDVAPVRVVPLTTDAGYEYEPAISPDGQKLAFVKERHIYVQLIGESESVPLTRGDARDSSPAWSPDGTRVAFLRRRGRGERDVLEVPALGGEPRALGRVNGARTGLAYSPDGEHLAVVHRESKDERDAIFLLSRETRELRRLTRPSPDVRRGDRSPKFSPDGARIAFERSGTQFFPVGDVLVHDLASGETRVLATSPGMLRGLDFTPDGSAVVYSVGMSWDSARLEAVSLDGRALGPLLPGQRAIAPSIARSADRAVYERWLDDDNIWRTPGPAADDRGTAERIFASTFNDGAPDLSPDGERLAFTSGRSGEWEIWTSAADGSSPRQLTHLGHAMLPAWSPDGARIAFTSAADDGVMDLFLVDAGGGFPEPLTDDGDDNLGPTWSPDGRYVYYVSDRDGETHSWRVPAEGGPTELVLENASFPRPTADGELLFWRDGKLWRAREGDAWPTELRLPPTEFTRWRGQVVFVDHHPGEPRGPSIDVFDLGTGATATLFQLERGGGALELSVSPDGRWVYFGRRESSGSDIMLVENLVP